MLLKAPALGLYIRVTAIIALLLGLNDAGRLLGINTGSASPIEVLGPAAFIYLGVFTAARLFAAVGMWIKASWGAFLLMATTLCELAIYLSGSPDVRLSAFGFAVRIILVTAIAVIFFIDVRVNRAHAAD